MNMTMKDVNKKEIAVIYETTDYSMFKFMDTNRRINRTNYAKLEASMKEKQLLIPILVNKDGFVVDGQHRVSVCKDNNLPVHYYIVDDYDISDVRRANQVSSIWTKYDFLNMHVRDNNEEYITFNNLMHKIDLNISDLLRLFSIIQNKKLNLLNKEFEDGQFSSEGSELVEQFIDALSIFNFFSYYKSKAFVTAFMRLYFNDRYNHKQMVDRLKGKGGKLEKKSTADDYLVLLTKDIYSFGATKNPIYYDKYTKQFH